MTTATGTPRAFKELIPALGVQGRVVHALMLREMQSRYGRSNIGYLWAIVEPLLLLSIFYAVFSFAGRSSHGGMGVVPFLATGIIVYLAIRNAAMQLSTAVQANRALLLYPQVTPLDFMIARAALEMSTFLVVFVLICGGTYLVGLSPLPADPFGVLLAAVTVMLLAFAVGLLQASLISMMPFVERLVGPMWRILLFVSCVFYTMDELPPGARELVALNPLAHGIELLRSAYSVPYESRLADYGYVYTWVVFGVSFGLIAERVFRDRRKAQ